MATVTETNQRADLLVEALTPILESAQKRILLPDLGPLNSVSVTAAIVIATFVEATRHASTQGESELTILNNLLRSRTAILDQEKILDFEVKLMKNGAVDVACLVPNCTADLPPETQSPLIAATHSLSGGEFMTTLITPWTEAFTAPVSQFSVQGWTKAALRLVLGGKQESTVGNHEGLVSGTTYAVDGALHPSLR
jgi:hypothetical protein